MSDVQSIPPVPTTPLPPQLEHSVGSSHKMPVAAKQSLINLSLGMGIMLAALSGGAYLMMTNKEVLLGGKASVDKQSSFSFAAPTEVKPGEQFTVDVMLDTSADPEYTISGADAFIQYSFTPDSSQVSQPVPTMIPGGDAFLPPKGEEQRVTGLAREIQDGSTLGLGAGGPNIGVGSGGAGISWEEQQRMVKPTLYPEFSLVKTEFGTIFDSYPATPSSFEAPVPGNPTPTSSPVAQIVCGGIRGTTCPDGMYCQYSAGAETDRFYAQGEARPIVDQTGLCVSTTKPTYTPQPLPPTQEIPPSQTMCGGIAGIGCPADMFCYTTMKTPDASGYCLPNTTNVKGMDGAQVLGATTIKAKKLAQVTTYPVPDGTVKSPPNPPEFMPPVRIIQGTTSISGLKNYAVDDQGYFQGFTGKGVFARLTFVANTTGKVELKFAYTGATSTDDSNINGFVKNVPVNIQKSSERLLTAPASLQVMIAKPVVVVPSPIASASGTPVPFIGLACNEKCGGIAPPIQVPPCGELSTQISNHTLSVNQNNDVYSNWGGLNEKWFVNEQFGSDRWYYMYKDGDGARVMSWSSGSGLTQGGGDVRADAPIASVSLQCYESLQPGFKFPSPDPSYMLRGATESESFRIDPKPCAPGLACVSGFCRNTSCSDNTSCLCGGATPLPKTICAVNADCLKGQKCYQPPMPPCPDGKLCAQMMPAPYCRQIVLPSGTPSPTSTPTPPPYPTSTPRPANQVSWRTGAASLEADDFEISINRNGTVKRYYARSGDLTVHSDMNPQNSTLELNWTEDGVPMRFYVYFTNLGSAWKVSSIRTTDGTAEGQWLFYKDAEITSLFNEIFISPKIVLTSSNAMTFDGSISVGTITMTNMRLQELLPLASPTPTPIPDKPVLNIALSLQGRSNHETKALVYQVTSSGESLLGQVQTDSNGNGSMQMSSTAIKMDPNLRLFVEVPGYLRKYHSSIGRSGIITDPSMYFQSGTVLASFGMLTAGDLNIGASGFGDHQVNSVDIAEMYTQWSSATEPGTGSNTNLSGDLNGDGVVNNRDYAIIMMNFGKKSGVVK